jgi:Bacterial regulatory proteins, luxR family
VDTSASEERPNHDRLLELIGDTGSLLEIEPFRHELLHAIVRAVPADWISLNDTGPDPGTVEVLSEPAEDAEAFARFARLAYQNPLVRHYGETRDGRVRRISDLTTQEEFHTFEIYTEVYGPMGVEYQLAFTLPLRGLGLTRRQADAVRMLATGAGENAIAESLGISLRTLQKHLQLAYRRLGAKSLPGGGGHVGDNRFRTERGKFHWPSRRRPMTADRMTDRRQPAMPAAERDHDVGRARQLRDLERVAHRPG